jgi:Spherulation-specific family 4
MKIRLLACFAIQISLVCGSGWAQSRLAVPSYQDPGSPQWNGWAAPGRQTVGMMIVNEDNGDDTSYHSSIAEAIRTARASGIFVVGYVYTGYGQRDPAVVRDRVDGVYRNYLVDGIFYDEAPTDCLAPNPFGGTNYSYYQQLGEYVRTRQAGGRLVILNPGTQPANDCWMSIANILVTAESSSLADYTTNYQDQPWFHQYPPERFWHIVYAAPGKDQLGKIVALSQARGAGWLYVTDLGGDNPYAGPPTYWNAESAAIANQGIQALYATARPASMDESGNAVPAKVSFRWKALNGTHWQILVSDGSQRVSNESTAGGTLAAPKERIEVGADGKVQVFIHGRDGDDKDWVEINAHAVAFSLQEQVHLVELDSRGLGESATYQIRSFDRDDHVLSISGPISLSVTNTQYIFDVTNH